MSNFPSTGSVWRHYKHGDVYAVVGDAAECGAISMRWGGDGDEHAAFTVYGREMGGRRTWAMLPRTYVAYAKPEDEGIVWYRPLTEWYADVVAPDPAHPESRVPRFVALDVGWMLEAISLLVNELEELPYVDALRESLVHIIRGRRP